MKMFIIIMFGKMFAYIMLIKMYTGFAKKKLHKTFLKSINMFKYFNDLKNILGLWIMF